MKDILMLAVPAVTAAFCFIMYALSRSKNDGSKRTKRRKRLFFWAGIISAWFLTASGVNILTGGAKGLELELEMFAPHTTVLGFSAATTTVTTWVIIAVVLVLALIFRFFCFPRFKDSPKGLQNVIETAVEAVDKFTASTVNSCDCGCLASYMFSTAVLLVGCAAAELFGVRPPTSDLVMTLSLGLTTFFLINYYSIKKKTLGGRLKSLATPSPIIFPMRVLSDVAVPVSLACRLFGNMLGGMIVMDLLKSALGGYSVGLTSVAGLYFNLFHPLIQTYIFITLSLTFINEATE